MRIKCLAHALGRTRRFCAAVLCLTLSIVCPASGHASDRGSDAIHPAFAQRGPKLVGSGGVGSSRQGVSAAISGDGNTAIVGGNADNGNAGAAWVWTKGAGVWSQQGPKLVGSGAAGFASFQGFSVALSADGNTAIVGGYSDNINTGAVWIWTRTNGVWTQQGSKLIGSGAVGTATQGYSVSLSADGNTAIVGGPADNSNAGAAWIWTRTNGVWTQQGSKLVGSGAAGTSVNQGQSVALSADGNTAIVGGNVDSNFAGAAWVWTRSGGVWTQQGPKLFGTGAVGMAEQGISVALSADGNTAMVGGWQDNHSAGAAWVWTRSGGVWTQQGNKLAGTGAQSIPYKGWSVSLSADGNVAIVGGFNDNNGVGAVWFWSRSGGVWSQQGTKVVCTGAVGAAQQGRSVSLSDDGRTAIVGGFSDNGNVGAAWILGGSGSGDFDGDAKSDRTVFRPSNGVWYSALSSGGAAITGWGVSTDIDVAGDYDGDGKLDVAVWRPDSGTYYILRSSNSTVLVVTWGASGDVPLAGDVDGDGKADQVIYRPSTGVWYFNKSGGGTGFLGWGTGADQPLLGDFDGDGRMDPTIFRPGTGVWYIALSGGGTTIVGWGVSSDVPVIGDFDGDGKCDITVFRPSSGDWLVNKSTGGVIVVTWGLSTDIPVSGDWDGDGKSDFTVWRPGTGVWYTQFAAGGFAGVGWGINGDRPIGRQPGT